MSRYFGSPVAARVFDVTSAPQGGWPTLGGAPFYFNGYSYIGYANNAGGIRLVIFDHSTGADVAPVASRLESDGFTSHDQHNKPALLRRSSDDKLVAVYCDHDGANMYLRITVNDLVSDPTISGGWVGRVNLDSQLGSTAYTYPALFEFGTDIMLFYRDNDGLSNWEISTHAVDTTNLATGWSAFTNLVFGTRAYALAFQPSSTRLDIFVTDGSYCSDAASLYHFYRDGTAYKTSDGSSIAGSPPFAFADLTLVYDGSTAGVRAPASVVNDGSGIAVVFPVQTGTCGAVIGADEDYLYARATVGSATWTVTTVASAIGGLTTEYTEGSLAIDPADIDHLIVSKRASSSVAVPFHLYDYLTADAGATWATVAVSLSGLPDMYPWFIRSHQPELEYVWLKGTFTSQSVFNDGIEGYGTP